jgi:Rab5 GDP/GTP exchange factor
MDSSSLSNITQQEFEKNVEEAIQDLPPSPTSGKRIISSGEMSPFAAATPGEEAARPLSLSTAAFDNTRRFFQKTGSFASEAVSKPLNAIGKILDGMQDESGNVEESLESQWRAGGVRDRESELRHDEQFNLATPRRNQLDTPGTPTSRYSHLGISPGNESPLR